MTDDSKFELYAIVELFGHNIVAGLVSEQTIGGQSFVRVDVPATERQEAFTKFYGGGAIYAITPCDEATMRQAVAELHPRPIETYRLSLPVPSQQPDDNPGVEDDDYQYDPEESG